jgi:hypothetical protein
LFFGLEEVCATIVVSPKEAYTTVAIGLEKTSTT